MFSSLRVIRCITYHLTREDDNVHPIANDNNYLPTRTEIKPQALFLLAKYEIMRALNLITLGISAEFNANAQSLRPSRKMLSKL